MMEIVTEEHVGGGSLLGDGFERGMGLEHAHHGEPAAVGNAQQTDAAVVVRNVFDEPVDAVVGVRAFIDGLGIVRVANWPLHDEFAFRAVAAANVLKDEDVAFRNHFRVAAEFAAVALLVVAQAIRRALKDHGQRLRGGFWRINFRVQLQAVARRDHDVSFVEERRIVGAFLLLRGGGQIEQNYGQQKKDKLPVKMKRAHELGPPCLGPLLSRQDAAG